MMFYIVLVNVVLSIGGGLVNIIVLFNQIVVVYIDVVCLHVCDKLMLTQLTH